MRRSMLLSLPGLLLAANALYAADTPYANAVKSLTPTYYYELNEPNALNGVTDSMGNAAKGSYNGDYAGGAPEAGCAGPLFTNENQDGSGDFNYVQQAVPGVGGTANLAHCSNNQGHIILGPGTNYGANSMTVSMFMKANFAEGGDRLFTNNLSDPNVSFQLNVANDGLVVSLDPNQAGEFAERTLTTADGAWDRALIREDYGWFHIVASTFGAADQRASNIQVWVNGENRTENLVVTNWGWGINTEFAKIGGRRDNPTDTTTRSGAQDEVAIWLNRTLTNAEVQTLWKAAKGEFVPTKPGDYNKDGVVNAVDADLQAVALKTPTQNLATYDENKDGTINIVDREIWVASRAKTWMGDANLDLVFDSSDFVDVFTAGLYETGKAAGWSQGDWNGDQLFDSGDFVIAFADGGYEKGPRAAVQAVPEPSSALLALLSMASGLLFRRRK